MLGEKIVVASCCGDGGAGDLLDFAIYLCVREAVGFQPVKEIFGGQGSRINSPGRFHIYGMEVWKESLPLLLLSPNSIQGPGWDGVELTTALGLALSQGQGFSKLVTVAGSRAVARALTAAVADELWAVNWIATAAAAAADKLEAVAGAAASCVVDAAWRSRDVRLYWASGIDLCRAKQDSVQLPPSPLDFVESGNLVLPLSNPLACMDEVMGLFMNTYATTHPFLFSAQTPNEWLKLKNDNLVSTTFIEFVPQKAMSHNNSDREEKNR